ncbi:thermonuclease family protein [Rhizobium herbae]|uniref:TNase-like domain-containing protein n=1 Tax=Rhizobium herbae TaxID=508661 RepID=A0ABS4ELE2_9HYPH|nr:hypothetical protein [Rhizobium herbae]MBP1858735.1 hypothetical protein [Rhizobium herbae]
MEVYVRLRGIDVPELKSSCAAKRNAGQQARAALTSLTSDQREIELMHISGDKYFGRPISAFPMDGIRLRKCCRRGLCQPYDGGRKSCVASW